MESYTLKLIQDPETYAVLAGCGCIFAWFLVFRGASRFARWIDKKWGQGIQIVNEIIKEVTDPEVQE